MSRDIKFRVWFKPEQKMYVPTSITFTADTGDVYSVHFPVVYFAPRSDVELMQYTGMLDAKGKEMYEGDIVCDTASPKWRRVVEWTREEDEQLEMVGFVARDGPEWEVIGNIWETPELLPP